MNITIDKAKEFLATYGKYMANEYIEDMSKMKIVDVCRRGDYIEIDFEETYYTAFANEFLLTKEELITLLKKRQDDCLEHKISWKKKCEDDLIVEDNNDKIEYLKGEIKSANGTIEIIKKLKETLD